MCLARTTRAAERLGVDLDICVTAGASVVNEARNLVLHFFLQTQADYLFWVDSDITWRTSDFFKMLRHSTIHGIVMAAYPAKTDSAPFKFELTGELPTDGLYPARSGGLGFTIMPRSVVEQLADLAPRVDIGDERDVADVFRIDRVVVDGRRTARGEDNALFADLQRLGHTVWLDPDVQLGHVGSKVYAADPRIGLRLNGE
jgi:hypothetical protein